MKRYYTIPVLLLTISVLLSGCLTGERPVPEPVCPDFLEPAIREDLQRYTVVMSSSPGIPFGPDLGWVNASACSYRYRWKASDGLFLDWEPPGFQVQEVGATFTREYGKVYWTWKDQGIQGKNVTITLEVLDPAGVRVLGRAEREISWDGEYAIVQPNENAIGECRFSPFGEEKKTME
ncbi:MAG: hypothetical protein MUC66_02675 [Methanolinea sp.]|jgi:hypothetical protein|nr:hypothetical protein [Methanolinea sp.]